MYNYDTSCTWDVAQLKVQDSKSSNINSGSMHMRMRWNKRRLNCSWYIYRIIKKLYVEATVACWWSGPALQIQRTRASSVFLGFNVSQVLKMAKEEIAEWDVGETSTFIKENFGEEVASKFEGALF